MPHETRYARTADVAVGGTVVEVSQPPGLVAGAALEFESRGENELTGVPGARRLNRVVA
jgi:hypothetical protein